MRFAQFFANLQSDQSASKVSVDDLAKVVRECHQGVGTLTFRFFPDFEGAQAGNFLWLDEERTSPYDCAFNNAIVFVNDKYRSDKPMRRFVAAKELMHVFDDVGSQTRNASAFRTLVSEIGSAPLQGDASAAYEADRVAQWKATIAMVPPWLKEPYQAQWRKQEVKAHELAVRWELPEVVVAAAMGEYYDRAYSRFVGSPRIHAVSSIRR